MNDELSLGHGGEYGFDDCRIDVIHDLLGKWGMWNSKEAGVFIKMICLITFLFSHRRKKETKKV